MKLISPDSGDVTASSKKDDVGHLEEVWKAVATNGDDVTENDRGDDEA